MTRIALTVPAQVASWVRPALTVAFLCVRSVLHVPIR